MYTVRKEQNAVGHAVKGKYSMTGWCEAAKLKNQEQHILKALIHLTQQQFPNE